MAIKYYGYKATPIAPTVTVGQVSAVAPDSAVDVQNTGTKTDAVLNFKLPMGRRGFTGEKGEKGEPGLNGTNGTNGINGTNATTKAYDGTTLRAGAFPVFKSAAVTNGVALFYLTNNNLPTGTTLFPNGIIADSVNLIMANSPTSLAFEWAFSNLNKTLTVTSTKPGTIKLSIWGY